MCTEYGTRFENPATFSRTDRRTERFRQVLAASKRCLIDARLANSGICGKLVTEFNADQRKRRRPEAPIRNE